MEIDDQGRETYGLADERLGGAWGYWFCADCNNRTGLWDECYTAWSRTLQHLLDTGSAKVGQRLSARISAAPNSVIVTAPPFVALLVNERYADVSFAFFQRTRFFDTGAWLIHSADSRQDVEFELPIVEMGPLPMIGEPVV